VKLTGGACKSMNHAQKYLAQANRHIAELAVQIAHQRAIVKNALDTGQGSEMAESLLDALEASLRIFEKHRIFLLSLQRISSALPPGEAAMGRSLSRGNGHGRTDHSRRQLLAKAAMAASRVAAYPCVSGVRSLWRPDA
jgi:hypothetical protein